MRRMWRKMVRVALLGILGLAGAAAGMQAQSGKVLRVAAAADLQPVMPVFAQVYERKTGVKLMVSFGSSGELTTQILNGGPFDVFLGADFSFPEKVVAENKAQGQAVPYAKGTLVIWERKDGPVQPPSIDRVTDPRVQRIAVADQFRAPYGRAAYAALTWLKLMDRVKGKLVVAENVSQAAQFAETGNAQVALISQTLASSPKLKAEGTFTPVDPQTYPTVEQYGVVIRGEHAQDARAFLEWIRSPEVQNHLQDFGLRAIR